MTFLFEIALKLLQNCSEIAGAIIKGIRCCHLQQFQPIKCQQSGNIALKSICNCSETALELHCSYQPHP